MLPISSRIRKSLSFTLQLAFFATFGEYVCRSAESKVSRPDKVSEDQTTLEYRDKVGSFFERHCYDCHDDETKKGGLDLFAVTPDFNGSEQVLQWTDIQNRVESGEMPPKNKARPTTEEISEMLSWLSPRLHQGDRKLREVIQRRLNRIEYENTMHDLLDIDIPLKHLLPEDQELHGFDNNGAALAISSEHMMRYLMPLARRLMRPSCYVHVRK